MKRLLIIVALALVPAVTLWAQSGIEQAKKLVAQRDYAGAYSVIQPDVRSGISNVDALMLAGEIYLEMDKPDSATVFFAKAHDISDTPETARLHAKGLSKSGKHKDAFEILKKLVKKNGKDAFNHLALAEAYLDADSLRQGELAIINAREINGDLAEVHLALGNLYFAQGVFELAKNSLDEALKINPSLIDARIKLAASYSKMANAESDSALYNELFARSLKEWNTVGQQDPNNARAWYEQGKIFYLASKWGESAKAFYKYVQLRPDNYLARWFLAQASFKIKQYDSAAVQLPIVAQHIDSVRDKAILMLAQSKFESKKFSEAAASYKEVSKSIKLDQTDYERYGYAAINSGDTTTTIDCFYKAIDGEIKKCNLMYRFGHLLRDKKRFDEAISIFRKRIAICDDSNSIRARLSIGQSYYNNAKYDSALISINEYLALDPSNLFGRIVLANCYNAMKQVDSAKSILANVIETGRQMPNAKKSDIETALSTLCGWYLDAKDFTAIQKYGKIWLEINPESVSAYIYTAVGYQGAGDKDNACKYYKEALKRDANNKTAKQNLKALGC